MKVEYDCEVCGVHVKRSRSPATMNVPPRFCSQACNGASRRGTGVGPTPNRMYDCERCGKYLAVYRAPSVDMPRFCSLICSGASRSGDGNYFWTGNAKPLRNGYTRSYSLGRTTYTHRAVVEMAIGRRLDRIEVVHHMNRDKTDNRIDNLLLLPNQATHAALHAREDRGF